jgi:hypothetical protein
LLPRFLVEIRLIIQLQPKTEVDFWSDEFFRLTEIKKLKGINLNRYFEPHETRKFSKNCAIFKRKIENAERNLTSHSAFSLSFNFF